MSFGIYDVTLLDGSLLSPARAVWPGAMRALGGSSTASNSEAWRRRTWRESNKRFYTTGFRAHSIKLNTKNLTKYGAPDRTHWNLLPNTSSA
ncbi:hypothetical protein J6590_020616 [Homalodisca vitripennis]|nr:hypothetical protein J6590_020616 [Homalodisca vitripennis]